MRPKLIRSLVLVLFAFTGLAAVLMPTPAQEVVALVR